MKTEEIEKELREMAQREKMFADDEDTLIAAADIIAQHEGLKMYEKAYLAALDACMWMHDDKTLDISLGADITSAGVLALKKQRDYLAFENDALCDFINREMKMTATDPRIQQLRAILEKDGKIL